MPSCCLTLPGTRAPGQLACPFGSLGGASLPDLPTPGNFDHTATNTFPIPCTALVSLYRSCLLAPRPHVCKPHGARQHAGLQRLAASKACPRLHLTTCAAASCPALQHVEGIGTCKVWTLGEITLKVASDVRAAKKRKCYGGLPQQWAASAHRPC